MKKNTYLLCLLLAASVLFTSCRDRNDDEPDDNTPYISSSLDGVVINGVRWATRNVDAPGTFAASPERAGMFFQWGKRTGWAATGSVTDWDNSRATSPYWTHVNDPCPPGWRIPTEQEFISLSEATTGFTFDSWEWHQYLIRYSSRHRVENWRNTGVNGLVLGVAPNFIFLPAAGERNWRNGTLEFAGILSYWSSTAYVDPFGSLWFTSTNGLGISIGSESSPGKSVRCVADE